MRGCIYRRHKKGSWHVVIDLGYEVDPTTGRRKRKQKWFAVRGKRKDAEDKLTELLGDVKNDQYIEPSALTLGEWLTTWLELTVKPAAKPATYTRYEGIVRNHVAKAPIARIAIQKIRGSHIEAYYATVPAGSRTVHHSVFGRAFTKALKDRRIASNPILDLDRVPRKKKMRDDDAKANCWTAAETRTFLATAKAAGPQPAALYALAIDSGARKGELCGLPWDDVDLDACTIRITRQLTKPGPEPTFGTPKNGCSRGVTLSASTVELLKAHKRTQAEAKMANRTTYHDLGLVFAKDYGDLSARRGDQLGLPLQSNNLGGRQFSRLIKAAKVKRITFHGMRHTTATLLLQAGEPVHVVSKRLGHSSVTVTWDTYAHVLPDQQQQTAATMGAILNR